jgi:transcriptional regulator with XRE-family HTH domain
MQPMGKSRKSNSSQVLRRAIDHAGSQSRLAEMLGVTPARLARWIAGKGLPPREVFIRALELWATEEYADEQKLAESLVFLHETERKKRDQT